MVLWFEAVHDSLTSDLNKGSDSLTDLTEEFYDYFLVRAMQETYSHAILLMFLSPFVSQSAVSINQLR